ncbi:MAG: DUF1905 domain-containing protein [Phycisphaerales bacterium]|nr:DUF1905 domain-containing protein [Phycisphaerales bacterium]
MTQAARSKTFDAEVVRDHKTGGCGIALPFDPKAVFGKTRVPVVATLRGYSYRTTTFLMGGACFIPLAKKHRDGAGVEAGERVRVRLQVDDMPREVEAPADLLAALRQVKGALAAWEALSYTHKREHVQAIEGAKKPETRARRIFRAVEMVTSTLET